MELPSELKPQTVSLVPKEHFVIENDGFMQLIDGVLGFGGLTLVALYPSAIFLLAITWLFLQWPLSNWRNSGAARFLSAGLHWSVICCFGLFIMFTQLPYPSYGSIDPVWLNHMYTGIFSVICLFNIILAFPHTQLTQRTQVRLKEVIKHQRLPVNFGFGVLAFCFLAWHDLRFFAPKIIMLWLLFNTFTLRFAPDAYIAHFLKKIMDWLGMAILCLIVFIFPAMYPDAYLRSVLMAMLMELPRWICVALTVAIVINNSIVLYSAKLKPMFLKDVSD